MAEQLEYTRGEQIAGRYEVMDELGDNSLAVAYRVKDTEKGGYLLLWVLRPELAGPSRSTEVNQAFASACSVRHENLLEVLELGEANGCFFVLMADFEGVPLRSLLSDARLDGKSIDVKLAAQVAGGVLGGMAAVHQAGGVIRAVRPELVLVQSRTTGPRQTGVVAKVKLAGAFLFDLVATHTLVEDEFTRGDAQYMAPEFRSHTPEATPRSDLFSCGVMLYEMLVGTPPIGTFQLPAARRPDLPVHLNTVIELALAQAPGDRYPGAAEFQADIQRAFEADGEAEVKRPLITPLGVILALVTVSLIAAIAFLLRPNPEKEALAADSQVRAAALEQQDRPSDAEITSVLSRHPQNMVFVPSGPFVRGRMHSEGSKQAPQSEPLADLVHVDAFLIDIFESPNLKGADSNVQVNHADATTVCQEQGKRLCTEHEWEKACKGPKNTIYSWGDMFDAAVCGVGMEAIEPAGSRPDCRSGWGVFDISGNNREWTDSAPNGKENRRVVKGGLKGNPEKGARCALTTDASVAYKDGTLSFRCCRDLDAPPAQ